MPAFNSEQLWNCFVLYMSRTMILLGNRTRETYFLPWCWGAQYQFCFAGKWLQYKQYKVKFRCSKIPCNRQLILLQGSSSLQLACSRRSAFSRCTIYSLPTDRSALLSERLEQATLELALFTPSPKKTLTISNDSWLNWCLILFNYLSGREFPSVCAGLSYRFTVFSKTGSHVMPNAIAKSSID